MAELRRSETTFRRSGSSGLAWDETFLASRDQYPSRIKNRLEDRSGWPEERRRQRSKSSTVSRRGGGGGFPAHADAGVISPAVDCLSPRPLFFCCPFAGKSSSTKPPPRRRRS